MPFSAAVLTVSDTASKDAPSDRSGPVLVEALNAAGPYELTATAIVPDERDAITSQIQHWHAEGIQLIVTSGGTGFGTRDCTSEAVASLISKPAPGLVHLILSSGVSKVGPIAALSRPVAGVCTANGHSSILITVPGSPKGAKESLDAVLEILPHALDLASGGSGKDVHRSMQSSAPPIAPVAGPSSSSPQTHSHHHHHGHHHHHHHHHHHGGGHQVPVPRTSQAARDPSSQVASRQRKSPYPMLTTRQAIDLILDNTFTKAIQTVEIKDVEIGHVIGVPLVARHDVPQGPTTNVDGYAVRASDKPGVYKVLTQFPRDPVPHGTIYRINTGAPLPPGTDSVIMVEDTEVRRRGEDDEELEVELLAQVDLGENVRRPGSDVKKGETVLEAGDVITAVGGELGTLAFVNAPSVAIRRRPVVAVLSTGNELFDVCQSSSSQPFSTSAFTGIPDSNRLSLLNVLRSMNFDTVDLGIIGDTMEETTQALKRGKEQADVVITTGGTSMGVSDLIKPCIETQLKGKIHFGRVAMKPGKPTTFATLSAHPLDPEKHDKLVFALPGNPASALVTFFIFVLPALRKMEGRLQASWELPRVKVELNEDVPLDPRPEYHRVSIRPEGNGLKAYSTGGQRSSRTVSLARANGLLELPALTEGGTKVLRKGSYVDCVVLSDIHC